MQSVLNRAYCYAGLAVSSLAVHGRNYRHSPVLIAPIHGIYFQKEIIRLFLDYVARKYKKTRQRCLNCLTIDLLRDAIVANRETGNCMTHIIP